MRRQQLEARVLQVVEHVTRGRTVEDNLVELKADWPTDHRKAARQIGGHANAAAGDDILWIIGIDEDAHSVRATTPTEIQHWWGKVERCFSEVAPELEVLSVRTFRTSRGQYAPPPVTGLAARGCSWWWGCRAGRGLAVVTG